MRKPPAAPSCRLTGGTMGRLEAYLRRPARCAPAPPQVACSCALSPPGRQPLGLWQRGKVESPALRAVVRQARRSCRGTRNPHGRNQGQQTSRSAWLSTLRQAQVPVTERMASQSVLLTVCLLAAAARPPGVHMPSPVRFQFPSLVHLFLLSKTWRLLLFSRVLQVEGLDAYASPPGRDCRHADEMPATWSCFRRALIQGVRMAQARGRFFDLLEGTRSPAQRCSGLARSTPPKHGRRAAQCAAYPARPSARSQVVARSCTGRSRQRGGGGFC